MDVARPYHFVRASLARIDKVTGERKRAQVHSRLSITSVAGARRTSEGIGPGVGEALRN